MASHSFPVCLTGMSTSRPGRSSSTAPREHSRNRSQPGCRQNTQGWSRNLQLTALTQFSEPFHAPTKTDRSSHHPLVFAEVPAGTAEEGRPAAETAVADSPAEDSPAAAYPAEGSPAAGSLQRRNSVAVNLDKTNTVDRRASQTGCVSPMLTLRRIVLHRAAVDYGAALSV